MDASTRADFNALTMHRRVGMAFCARLLLSAAFAAIVAVPATANPVGGQVSTGAATISSNGNNTAVKQTSEGVVINWSSFNVGSGQTTQFYQPNAQALAVNRIGSKNASQILGTLDANGNVVLINGNGLLFGKNARVNVGSLVTTSTDGTDSDLLAGKFTKAGSQSATIVNHGVITVGTQGTVALVAPNITNTGIVNAKLGTVSLGAANKFTVDLNGDGLVSFAAQGDVNGKASVINKGRLVGANVSMTAHAAEGIATGVVNTSGVIVAQGAHEVGGSIVLDAGDGGSIDVSGGKLEAKGPKGGGSITVGNWDDASVTVNLGAILNASATKSGDGGHIKIVSSNTLFRGNALARGGVLSGNGGLIETSGRGLDFLGSSIDAGATHGKAGTWLLDPDDLDIDSADAAEIGSTLGASGSGTNVELQTTSSGCSGGFGTCVSGSGDINIEGAISWGSSATLTLDAYHSLNILAPISITGAGSVALQYNDEATDGVLSFGLTSSGFAGSVNYGSTNNGGALSIMTGGSTTDYTLLYSTSSMENINSNGAMLAGNYALATSLDASSWTPIGRISAPYTGTFEGLGNTISSISIDLPSKAAVGLFGQSLGLIRDVGVVGGSVTGAGLVGGLVGEMAGDASVVNSYSTAAVSGSSGIGGLVGGISGNAGNSATITEAFATGTVTLATGGVDAGGLVGSTDNFVVIASSYATGLVIAGSGSSNVGGLAGTIGTTSTISNSYALGAVEAPAGTNIGGFVGLDSGPISGSYSSGLVSAAGGTDVGGFVGDIPSSDGISNSYWDTDTSGIGSADGVGNLTNAAGITGETTSALQGALPSGFTNTVWSNVPGKSYPYLSWQFSGTPQVFSGIVSSGASVAQPGVNVGLLVNGTAIDPAVATSSGANGYYYLLLAPGTISSSGSNVFAYIENAGINGNFFDQDLIDSRADANIHEGSLELVANSSDSASLIAALDDAVGSSSGSQFLYTTAGGFAPGGKTFLWTRNSSFMIDTALDFSSGFFDLIARGSVSENGGTITAASFEGSSSGGTALNGDNTISRLLGFTNSGGGGFALTDTETLHSSGTVNAGSGGLSLTTTSGDINIDGILLTTGTVDLASAGSIDEIAATGGIDTATLEGSSQGRVSLQGTNLIGTLASFDTGDNGFFLLDGETLTTSAAINVGAASLSLTTAAGDLNIDGAINTRNLTLDVYHSLNILAPVSIAGAGAVDLQYNGENTDGVLNFDLTSTGFAGGINFGAVNKGATLTINGAPYTLLYSMSDVQAINNNLSGDYALATPINASYIANWTPIGYSSTSTTNATVPTYGTFTGVNANPSEFRGTFDGLGNAISNLVISNTGAFNLGLFSLVGSSGTVRNVGLIGGSTTGGDGYQNIGTLVGWNYGTIANAYETGPVTVGNGTFNAGGLVGWNWGGTISDSHATGDVTGTSSGDIGGLVGFQGYYLNGGGTIIDSFATGTVSGSEAGGLVGYNDSAKVIDSYATGAVFGENQVGGLIGGNDGYWGGDLVTGSYATGTATGDSNSIYIGGLIGDSIWLSTVTNSYATGRVTGGNAVGGLIGWNGYLNVNQLVGSTITSSYSTGLVSGVSNVGGLVGYDNSGTITSSYWDKQTSGTNVGIGGDNNNQSGNVIGLTTAALQSALPGGFSNSVWGTGTGLYPYFLWQYPSGTPQAISGFAYKDGGTTVDAGDAISVLANGNALTTGSGESTGANGYFYILVAPGTFTGTQQVLAASTYGAALVENAGGSVSNANIYGNALDLPTTASSLSTTTVQSGYAADLATAEGSNSSVSTFTAGLSGLVVSSSAPTYTIDTAVTFDGPNLGFLDPDGNIAVTAAQSWSGANTLTLNANGSLTIDAPITINGAGGLALDYSTASPTNFSFGLTSAGFSGRVSYATGSGEGVAGQSLTINGTPYTLLYSMSDVQNINNNLSGNYALATTLDASSVSGWVSLGTDGNGNVLDSGNGFTGAFEGLGNTVSNLTISSPVNYIGLFGWSTGTITNVGMTGGAVNGNSAGGLTTVNGGTLDYVFATNSISGLGEVGGLVGYNYGTILDAFATGAVTGNVAGNHYIGGLVGINAGSISNSYATGAVTGDDQSVGGLIGANDTSVTNVYATGAVNGGSYVGALIGSNIGTVTDAYATGAVSGGSFLGGLIGGDVGTITNSYWDTQSTGQTSSVGGVGQTTAQLQSALPGGFSSSVWSIIPGKSYPYLSWQFSGTPEVISGLVRSGTNGVAGVNVGLLMNGAAVDPAVAMSSGADGYYYLLLASGTISSSGSNVLAYIENPGVTGNFFDQDLDRSRPNTNIQEGVLVLDTDASDSASMLSALDSTMGSNNGPQFLYTEAGGFVPDGRTVLRTRNSSFSIDTTLDFGNGFFDLLASGSVSESDGAITAASVEGSSSGGATLNGDNAIGRLLGFTNSGGGGFALTDSETLSSSGTLNAGSGGLSLTTTSGGIDIGGLLETAGTADLVSAGVIAENTSTGAVDAATLEGSSQGRVSLQGANLIGTLTSFDTHDNGFFLQDGETLTTTAPIDVGAASLSLTTLAGDLDIDYAIDARNLTLDSYHTLNILAPVSIAGAGAVVLQYNGEGTNGVLNFDLTGTGFVGSIDFGPINKGATLTINGAPYTLLYSMADVQNIDINLSQDYALATSLDASSFGNWTPIGYSSASTTNSSVPTPLVGVNATPSQFLGIFDGLGNTISNLTIDNTGAFNLGLFSLIGSSGIVRNVGLTGGNTTGGDNYENIGMLAGWNFGAIANNYETGSVTVGDGTTNVGGLIGWNYRGSISTSFATGDVSGGTDSGNMGGLVGAQGGNLDGGGTITESYATGNVAGGEVVGGLVGENNSANITDSYATGNVSGVNNLGGLSGNNNGYWGGDLITQSYATGNVTGGAGSIYVGGLIGTNSWLATLTNSYATGNVSGENAVGGLVGWNGYSDINQHVGATIESSYSTGFVSGTTNVGGLAGYNNSGTITSSYWDIDTSGQHVGIGTDNNNQSGNISGLTTTQLQSALPSGFSSSIWSIVAGTSYPYLSWQIPSGTPQVISGVIRNGTAPVSGLSVGLLMNGAAVDPDVAMRSGANGYYYLLLAPGTISSSGSNVFAYIENPGITGNFFDQDLNRSRPDTNIREGVLEIDTDAADSASMLAALDSTIGSSGSSQFLYTTSGGFAADGKTFLWTRNSNFTIDSALDFGGGFFDITAAGSVSENGGAITAASFEGSSSGGATLDGDNTIDRLLGFTNSGGGGFALTDTETLHTSGTVNAGSGELALITTSGDIDINGTLETTGTADLASAGSIAENTSTGAIDAMTLDGSSRGRVSLQGTNLIGTLGDFDTNGNGFSLTDGETLTTTGTLNAGSAIATLTTTAGDIDIDGMIEVHTLNLDSAGAANENSSGAIDVHDLDVSAETGIDLGSLLNDIVVIGTDSTTSGPNTINKS